MPTKTKEKEMNRMTREYTDRLIEMIDNGCLDAYNVVIMCVKAMSEDDVKWMMNANELGDE